MTKRHNHYEAAFEDLLRQRGIPYVAVNEAKRSILGHDGRASANGDGATVLAPEAGEMAPGAAEMAPGAADLRPKTTLKSLDFIVSAAWFPKSWLIDVKGRRFPSGRRRQYWRNWSTADDLRSLAQWERQFGARFCGLLVFAYEIWDTSSPLPPEQLFFTRGRWYAFCAIRLEHYLGFSRRISGRWDTLAMPTKRFRALAEPIDNMLERKEVANPENGSRDLGSAFR